jgi:hypothetical protein
MYGKMARQPVWIGSVVNWRPMFPSSISGASEALPVDERQHSVELFS